MKIGRSFGTQIAAHKVEADAHKLAVIEIAADKDWNGKSITNFKQLSLIHCGGIRLEDTLADDLCWSGIIIEGTAGENLAQFQTVYRKDDEKYWLAQADLSTTMPVAAMALEAIAADAKGKFLLFGWIRNDAWSLTAGQPAYQSAATAGLVTTTIPAGSGNQVQRVGMALTDVIAHFNPIYTVFEIT